MKALDEAQLKAAYRALLARERDTTPVPEVSPEVLLQLAEGTYIGGDRDLLLDRVLSHDETAREFGFLLELQRAQRQPDAARPWRRWALAASLVGVAALGVRYASRDAASDPFRASGDAVDVVAPVRATPFDSTTTFTWRPVVDAASYRLDVVREDGSVVATATTRDTVTVAAPSVPLLSGEVLSWWVTATLTDGTTRRSVPVALRAR